jgi:DNA primase
MNTDITWMDFNNADSQGNGGLAVSNPVDTEMVKSRLHSRISDVLSYLLPAGKIRHGKFHIGDIQGNPGDSMQVELAGEKTGVWYDHATGEGGDVFNLWAAARGLDTATQFPQVIKEIQDWLGESTQSIAPRPTSPSPRQWEPPMDELGPPTGKWDYLDRDGSLLVCMYRYDPPGKKKQFRPWDVKARKHQAPRHNRPLFNLHGIMDAQRVVFVEGEKCAMALIKQGIAATTAMHGANGPVDKTDWSPLSGTTVVIWPDKDKAGWDYAEAVTEMVQSVGANVLAILVPPDDKPEKWDAADAVAEGMDIQKFLSTAERHTPKQLFLKFRLSDCSRSETFHPLMRLTD